MMMSKDKLKSRYYKSKVKPIYPKSYEQDYYRILRALVRSLHGQTLQVLPLIYDGLKRDSMVDDIISNINQGLDDERVLLLTQSEIFAVLEGVDAIGKKNLIHQFAKAIGVDIFVDDTELLETIKKEWYDQQIRLEESIVSEYTSKLQTIVSNAVQRGTSYSEVRDQIMNLYGVTDKRAKFIARNEISNLNGILTKTRQEQAGIEVYEWSSSEDERVRPEHEFYDGKLFFWDKDVGGVLNGVKVYPSPPFAPGLDYNCRCVAIPIIDVKHIISNGILMLSEPAPKEKNAVTPST